MGLETEICLSYQQMLMLSSQQLLLVFFIKRLVKQTDPEFCWMIVLKGSPLLHSLVSSRVSLVEVILLLPVRPPDDGLATQQSR
jgi:hypothetical protein